MMSSHGNDKDKESCGQKVPGGAMPSEEDFSDLYGWQLNDHPEPKRQVSEQEYESLIDSIAAQLD